LKSLRLLLALVIFASAGLSFAGGRPAKSAKEKSSDGPLPKFEAVTRQVQQVLAFDKEYQAGDLLTASKVERVLLKLEQIHWKVADRREIVRLVLSDSDWLSRQLATRDGKQFMRQIGTLPGGFDRVDRLRRMPYGEGQISDFIENPEGSKMIEYMTTTAEGKNLGDQLSEGVNGRDFNKATGRIYTELDLLKRLKRSYDAEAARRLALEPKTTPQVEVPAAETPQPSADPIPAQQYKRKSTN
jgi:hypothetical protein